LVLIIFLFVEMHGQQNIKTPRIINIINSLLSSSVDLQKQPAFL